MIYWKFKYSRTQRALAVGVSVVKKTEVDAVLDDKINLVKYIVLTKLKEEDQRNKEREFKEKKQKILGLIADKQDNELQSKSIDELKDMLESLK